MTGGGTSYASTHVSEGQRSARQRIERLARGGMPSMYISRTRRSSSGYFPKAVQTAQAHSVGHATRPQFFVRLGPGFILPM